MNDVENLVANILTSPEAQKIKNFTFKGKYFTTGTFYNIRSLIECGFIKVVHDPNQQGEAEYVWASNTLKLGFTSTSELPKKALVVHEAVHAVYDMVKLKMPVCDSEAIAYIAQCQYARVNNPNPEDRLYSSNRKRDKVFQVAWGIAGTILDGHSPSSDDCEALCEAISQHPLYSANASSTIKSDG